MNTHIYATCVMDGLPRARIGVGKSYRVIGSDADRLTVQILDDHGEPAWVPAEFLDYVLPELPELVCVEEMYIFRDPDPRLAGEVSVMIGLTDGTEWTATFASFEYVGTIPRRSGDSDDTMHGTLFWQPDLILVDKLTEERIHEMVVHFVRIGAYPRAFIRMFGSSIDDHAE